MVRQGLIGLLLVVLVSGAEIIIPIPQKVDHDVELARLGQSLFFDTRLSADNTISCATCHRLDHGGAEPLAVSVGIRSQKGQLNAPTVFNAVFNIAQFWDGRAKDLVEQAKGPVINPIEMGHDFTTLIASLSRDTFYAEAFKRYFPEEGITAHTIATAISEYEKTLITPNSPFDRFLRGDTDALSHEAKEGFALFKAKGCVACHHGINIGGNQYQQFGAVIENRDIGHSFAGRFMVTGDEDDRYYVKVPSLRNVARTAPYFHTGGVKTLEEAVRLMAYHQLGIHLEDGEIVKISAFLRSLNGTLNEAP